MSGFHWNEAYIKEALDTAADSCNPPDDLKQQIDARLAWQEKREVIHMKKANMKKTVLAAVLACALTGTVCMAAEKFSGYYITGTSSEFTKVTDFAGIEKLEKKANVKTGAPKILGDGFVFESANIMETSEMDENGNKSASAFNEIDVTYKKDTKSLDYSVLSETGIEFTEEETAYTQVLEEGGVTYYYSRLNYLFVPDEADITAEDKEAEAAGELLISVGGDEREEQVYESLSWNADGQGYILFGADLEIGADELLEMAEQLR